MALLLVAGLGYQMYQDVSHKPVAANNTQVQDDGGVARRNQIAAAKMYQVSNEAGMQPQVAISLPPSEQLPQATLIDQNGIPSGFPHTQMGAVAQLAAIHTKVLTAMSIPFAVDTYI